MASGSGAAIYQKNGSKLVRAGFVNALPDFITLEADGDLQTTALEIEDEKIATIYAIFQREFTSKT